MNINLKRTGEVTFQVALTNEQIEAHLPKPTFDKDLQYSYTVTPTGKDLNHVEIKIIVQSFSGLKYDLDKKLGLPVEYMYQRLAVGVTHQNLFRLQLAIGPLLVISELYEPCNHIDRVLSGDLSATKLYIRELIQLIAGKEDYINELYPIIYSLVKVDEREKDNQADYDVGEILRFDRKGLSTYREVYREVASESGVAAYNLNKSLYQMIKGLRAATKAVKNHG